MVIFSAQVTVRRLWGAPKQTRHLLLIIHTYSLSGIEEEHIFAKNPMWYVTGGEVPVVGGLGKLMGHMALDLSREGCV